MARRSAPCSTCESSPSLDPAGAELIPIARCRDVVAFIKPGTEPRIGVISDNIDQNLTAFMRKLITEYGAFARLSAFLRALADLQRLHSDHPSCQHQMRLLVQRS